MLMEHQKGRGLVARLKAAIQEDLPGDKNAAGAFQSAAAEYVALLGNHIEKENNILFRMADMRLDSATDAALVAAFDKLEAERIGLGKHAEFHALLHWLEQAYLM